MKRETLIVIFYVLYFSWLFTVIYLSPETALLNVFTSVIVLFYFLFLRQEGDFVWFFATLVGAIFGRFISLENRRLSFDIQSINEFPIWLPLAWGTTVLALRKFFLILNVGKD